MPIRIGNKILTGKDRNVGVTVGFEKRTNTENTNTSAENIEDVEPKKV